VRYFICNTPPAYAVISVLHRPVESATRSGRSRRWSGRLRAAAQLAVPAPTRSRRLQEGDTR
jgi:hypothetical protein